MREIEKKRQRREPETEGDRRLESMRCREEEAGEKRQRSRRGSRKRCEKKTERLRQRPTDRQKPPETRQTRPRGNT